MAARLLTRAQAREALGSMPARSFNRLCAEGLPRKGEGKRERFPWPTIHAWYIDRIKRIERRAARPANFDEAKAREMAARAELAELELAMKRGELMSVGEFDAAVGGAFGRLRAALLNLPPHAAPELIGCADAPEAMTRLQGFVTDLMADLAGGDDVPAQPAADADGD